MSPELVTGQEYGTSSDVWAIGIVLFEMLALRRPFDGANLVKVAALIGRGKPLEEAHRALEASGHPEELKRLASANGLLHPVPGERTKLRRILEVYPPDANEGAESEVAEADRSDKLPQKLLKATVIGYVCIINIEVEEDQMTLLSPSAGPLPFKYLLVGSVKFDT